VVVQTHTDDGIESLEQITEAINSSTENIKEHYMNNRDMAILMIMTMAKEKG
jgi:hypothetical protein